MFLGLVAVANVKIPDKTFPLLANLVGIANGFLMQKQRDAIQRLHLKESPHEFGGRAEVPVKGCPPRLDFVF